MLERSVRVCAGQCFSARMHSLSHTNTHTYPLSHTGRGTGPGENRGGTSQKCSEKSASQRLRSLEAPGVELIKYKDRIVEVEVEKIVEVPKETTISTSVYVSIIVSVCLICVLACTE